MRRIPAHSLLLLATVATIGLVGFVAVPSWQAGSNEAGARPNSIVFKEAWPRCGAQSTIDFVNGADSAALALKVVTFLREGENDCEWAARHALAVRFAPRSLIGAEPSTLQRQTVDIHPEDGEYTGATWRSAHAGEIELVVEFNEGEDSAAIAERRASIDKAFLCEFPPNS